MKVWASSSRHTKQGLKSLLHGPLSSFKQPRLQEFLICMETASDTATVAVILWTGRTLHVTKLYSGCAVGWCNTLDVRGWEEDSCVYGWLLGWGWGAGYMRVSLAQYNGSVPSFESFHAMHEPAADRCDAGVHRTWQQLGIPWSWRASTNMSICVRQCLSGWSGCEGGAGHKYILSIYKA